MSETEIAVNSNPTKTIARVDLVNIYDMLGTVKNSVDAVQWRWRAAHMKRQLEPTVEPIVEQRDAVQKARPKELDEARTALCKDYAQKTEDGNPMISDNNFVIDPTRKKAFDAAFSDLIEKFKPQREAFDKLVEETNNWLREEVPMPAVTGRFPLCAFNKSASQEMLEVLFDFIDENGVEETDKKKTKKDKE